jgi:putative heme degradation protein
MKDLLRKITEISTDIDAARADAAERLATAIDHIDKLSNWHRLQKEHRLSEIEKRAEAERQRAEEDTAKALDYLATHRSLLVEMRERMDDNVEEPAAFEAIRRATEELRIQRLEAAQ